MQITGLAGYGIHHKRRVLCTEGMTVEGGWMTFWGWALVGADDTEKVAPNPNMDDDVK